MKSKKNRYKLEKGLVIGNWMLVDRLGVGGNGEVWEVSSNGYENHAMKLLKTTDAHIYERFKAETHILSNIKHDGIIPLIDFHLPDDINIDTPWFIMPKAISFEQYAEDKTPIELARQFVLLGDTLSYLHSRGISHRDIKPANILFYNDRLYLADFGLVKYPGKERITPEKRDVGAKFTMAPEMRREASLADGLPADVFSLAKSLWIVLTKQEKGFDGQYNPSSILAIKNYCDGLYTTPLDNLLSESTDTDAFKRPDAKTFTSRLVEWIDLNKNFHKRNLSEWLDVQQVIFPISSPSQATWTDIDSICSVLNEIGSRPSLNYMFYPTRGGMDLLGASKAEENGMLALHVRGSQVAILKPNKLTYESVGFHPEWNYFRLEAAEVEPTGIDSNMRNDDTSERLLEIEPGKYVEYDCWPKGEYNGAPLPEDARPVGRYVKGVFILFSKRSLYNINNDTCDALHERISEVEFREFIKKAAKHSFEREADGY